MANYLDLTDTLLAEIREGKLRPGDQLPPQREFAYARGIATSTAARVYSELIRRGFAAGEVGRGTFIRLNPSGNPALGEPTSLRIDLELNFPTVPEQHAMLSLSLSQLTQRQDDWRAALAPASARGSNSLRGIAAAFLKRPQWTPSPDSILFAGSGKQAIAATLLATVQAGERLGIEAMTYPFAKGIARQLGIRLVPLAMDDEGIIPTALSEAHHQTPLRAVYLQPTLHNPLGVTMSRRRKKEIANVLKTAGLIGIEDCVYSFLDEDSTPLQAFAGDHVVVIDSLSKRISPGLTMGFIVVPAALQEAVAKALHTGAWTSSAFAQAACARWMADGTAMKIIEAKRLDAAARNDILNKSLGRFDIVGNKKAFHCWLRLPEPWRADMFVAAAARRNIAVTPATAFAVLPGHVPNAVRLALSAPPTEILSSALQQIGHILDDGVDALLAG